jgi:hypothetical protein
MPSRPHRVRVPRWDPAAIVAAQESLQAQMGAMRSGGGGGGGGGAAAARLAPPSPMSRQSAGRYAAGSSRFR